MIHHNDACFLGNALKSTFRLPILAVLYCNLRKHSRYFEIYSLIKQKSKTGNNYLPKFKKGNSV